MMHCQLQAILGGWGDPLMSTDPGQDKGRGWEWRTPQDFETKIRVREEFGIGTLFTLGTQGE